MANETEKTILPYLNVLEVDTIDKSNVTKVIVIDKDDEVKVMDGSQLGSSNYQDLQFKPEINGVELNGNIPSKELGIPSIEDVDNQITEKLIDYPTKEEVTAEITEATSGKQDILVQGNGIVIEDNTISADYSTINNKPSLNGAELINPTVIVPSIQIKAIPDKVTIASIFGNQTGDAEELPVYNTETNSAGLINANLYAQLSDKYTKAEIDNLNAEINKAINSKQGTLTAGANISIVDNVISAFQNHFFLNLDINDPDRQLEIYNFIRSDMDFYLFGQITYNEDTIVVPMTVVEHTNTIDLYGYYFKDNGVLVTINAIIVNNGQMTVKTTEVDLTSKGYTKDEVDEKLATKQGVFTPQAPLAFNEDKSQLSVDLSGYQPVGDYATNDSVNEEIETLRSSLQSKIDAKQDKGDYALKSEIPTKVSELTNDSNFVTEAEVSGDLANKADKTYVDEQLATKQPVGDYATTSDLALKADKSTVDTLQRQVTSNTSAIATKQDTLISGESIRTINNLSLLGDGNINVGDVPSITVENEQIPNETDFNRVAEAAANNRAVLIRIKTTEMTLTSNYWQYISSESQRGFIAYATYLSGANNITLMAYIIENQPVMVETDNEELQEELVSGTNIKTINGQTLLGSGDIEVGGGGTSDYTQLTNKPQINSVELTGNKSLSDIGAQPAGDYALKSEIPDVSGLATKEEVTTGLSGKQDTLVSGTNIKTINSQSLVGSGNIDITADSIPTLFMTNSTTPDSETFDNVYSAIQNNQPYAIYYYSYPASMLYDTATISGENILAIFHNEYNTVHTSVFVTIKKGLPPEIRTDNNNYVKFGTGTQPQINTITVLTQAEYDGLSTKDPNTQYLIIE